MADVLHESHESIDEKKILANPQDLSDQDDREKIVILDTKEGEKAQAKKFWEELKKNEYAYTLFVRLLAKEGKGAMEEMKTSQRKQIEQDYIADHLQEMYFLPGHTERAAFFVKNGAVQDYSGVLKSGESLPEGAISLGYGVHLY